LIEFHEQNPWYDVPKHDYVTGQFLWPGIDYLGESMGWPSKGWPTGLLDTAGFLKPFSGFHRVVWKPDPAVHLAVRHDGLDRDNGPTTWHWPKLADHWNWVEGDRNAIEIHTYTNCESVELFVNERSYGVRRTADFPNNTIVWHAEYQSGRLIAVARNGGREVARDELATAGKPALIELRPDRTTLASSGEDLSHIEVCLVDEHGVRVQNADRRITFLVEGAGRLAGVDNGDMRSTEPYQAPYRTTRYGRCLAVVRSLRGPGRIHVTARSEGLDQATIEITVT
jgi:beta-galactosidase